MTAIPETTPASAAPETPAARRKRANGEASRERILDAAAEIAGERGYEGTSINLVSARSGLPASSIYWHFTNKDELVAAVIDRSFHAWVDSIGGLEQLPIDAPPSEAVRHAMHRIAGGLNEAPDFLRLGLMLILERRPEELSAWTKFLDVRRLTTDHAVALYGTIFPHLDDSARRSLAMLTMAAADGILVAHEIDDLDMAEAFDLLGAAILGAADHLADRA